MIPKTSSQELNDILTNANEKIAEVNSKIDTIKSDLHEKLMIMKYETDYVNDCLYKLRAGTYTKDGTMKSLISVFNNKYDSYGSVVHASFIKEPVNVFNLKVTGTGEVFFRDDMKVTVNGQTDDKYKSILKHESLTRDIFFEELTSPDVNITIETLEANKMLGPTRFNMIEIDSFLNGSYDITEMNIYSLNADGTMNTTPAKYSYPDVGKLRAILPEKVSFYKIEMKIKLKYKTKKNDIDIYPFGIKHLYLYDADFQPESYAILTLESDKNIASVHEDIRVKDTAGVRASTFTEEGIEVFVDNNNGVLDTPVPTSTANQLNIIARNVNILYVKIPLIGKALIGLEFTFDTK
jgi:hypothetical protein